MKKFKDEILDPSIGMRSQRANTEFYLGRLAHTAAILGISKQRNPMEYKNAVEQLEILAIGSGHLDKDYWKQKGALEKDYQKKIQELSKGINPRIKKSTINERNKKKMIALDMEYITKLHRLLMEVIAPLFYIKWKVERI